MYSHTIPTGSFSFNSVSVATKVPRLDINILRHVKTWLDTFQNCIEVVPALKCLQLKASEIILELKEITCIAPYPGHWILRPHEM